MKRTLWEAMLIWLMGVMLGIFLTGTAWVLAQPNCPTEDSCTVDYRDGAWHITEVTP